MAKQSGLGARFLVGGYDISGDVQALDTISGSVALLDATDITQSAHSRIAGLRDGKMGFTVFMDTANAHPVLSALPTTDVQMMALMPSLAVGGAVACLNAKQVGYDPTRAADGALTMKVEGDGNAYGLEWAQALTAGLRTDTTGTAGAALDNAAAAPYGAQAYLQVTAVSGTSVTVTVQQSADNSTWITLGPSLRCRRLRRSSGSRRRRRSRSRRRTRARACSPFPGSAPANGTVQALAGSVPTGFTAGTVYYVVSSSGTTFELSATSGGSAINSSSTGSGTVTPAVLRYLRATTSGTFNPATFAAAVVVNQAAVSF